MAKCKPMKCTFEQLAHLLKKNLAPCFWIASDEVFLRQEAIKKIQKKAEQVGFVERQILYSDEAPGLTGLSIAQANLSLFSNKKLILFHYMQATINKQNSEALCDYVNQYHADTFVIIASPKLDSNAQKSKGFKAFEKLGIFLPIWPLSSKQFPFWIKQRLARYEMDITPDALAFFVTQTEGNLLAAAQIIEQLYLQFGHSKINYTQLENCLSDFSRHDLYQFADNVLSGDVEKSLKQLQYLLNSGTAPSLLLWVLLKDCRCLLQYHDLISKGLPMHQAWQEVKVWSKRQTIMQAAAKRLSIRPLHRCVALGIKIDNLIKGMCLGNINIALTELVLLMADKPVLTVAVNEYALI